MKTTILLLQLVLLFSNCRSTDNEDIKDGPSVATHLDSVPVPGLTPQLKKMQAAIRAFADSTFKGRLNGAILVAKDGQILYEKYDGFSMYRSKKDSITANSSFHLASVSKTITGIAVLKLSQDGKLNVNDSITKYFPAFPSPGVTIKSLLNHRSGLPNYAHFMDRLGWDKKTKVTNHDVLDFLIARHEDIDIGAADRRFSYSNTNYALLALIIEKASGMSYKEYLKQTIFQPFGMKDSYVFTLEDSARSMPSYFNNGRQYAFDFLDLVYGDKNIYSTPHDLLKLDIALSSGVILRQDILDAACTPYSFEKPGTHNYGLGWRLLMLKNGKKVIYHNGWWHGNRTAFYRLPEEKVTIIALCNNDSKMIYSVRKLADLFGDYLQTGPKSDGSGSIVRTNYRNIKSRYAIAPSGRHSRSIASKK
ncbi:MAG: beta-lactamase family protein [Chitinophagaceae bacterium]|nr:beta-lactamase family protein [Chitinophagaceae bacterium]